MAKWQLFKYHLKQRVCIDWVDKYKPQNYKDLYGILQTLRFPHLNNFLRKTLKLGWVAFHSLTYLALSTQISPRSIKMVYQLFTQYNKTFQKNNHKYLKRFVFNDIDCRTSKATRRKFVSKQCNRRFGKTVQSQLQNIFQIKSGDSKQWQMFSESSNLIASSRLEY